MRSDLSAGIVVAALVATVGCAAIQKSDTMDDERSLAAAGFQMKFANSPDQLAKLEVLPQRKLTTRPFKGERRWVYADAKYCKCIYVGTQAAYGRYEKIAINKRIAQEQMDASMEAEASMDWRGWGAWGPWY